MSEQPPRASGHLPLSGTEAPRTAAAGEGAHTAEGAFDATREERIRAGASARLDQAADAARKLGHRVREQGGVAARTEPVAYRVGDSLQDAASYVRGHDLADMRDDVEDGVRAAPLKALAIAAATGFLIGRIIR